MMALSWALEMTEHFTMQNPKLVISTDHKPLVELIMNTSLAGLQKKNKWLARFKQCMLSWRTTLRQMHYPGDPKQQQQPWQQRGPHSG